jgi:predicted DNA-binding transcriptional regulator YafY
MDRLERFYKIDHLLQANRVVSLRTLQEELEVSPATLKRDLEYMRSRFNAPIIWDRAARGYRFGEPRKHGPRYQLPGLWFNASEAHALLTMQHLLENIEPGLIGQQVKPLQDRAKPGSDHSFC